MKAFENPNFIGQEKMFNQVKIHIFHFTTDQRIKIIPTYHTLIGKKLLWILHTIRQYRFLHKFNIRFEFFNQFMLFRVRAIQFILFFWFISTHATLKNLLSKMYFIPLLILFPINYWNFASRDKEFSSEVIMTGIYGFMLALNWRVTWR